MKLTAEHLQQELEVIGRLLTQTKAEIGSLRDEVRIATRVAEDSSRRADKLVDRLIEMSLVTHGAYKEASIKARAPSSDPTPFGSGVVEEEEDDEWPPKGMIAMDVK